MKNSQVRGYMTIKEVVEKYKRKGSCDPTKCKAACCRFTIMYSSAKEPSMKYLKGMGFKVEKIDGHRYIILERPCDYLNQKTNRCKRHSSKPWPCKHFPIPSDAVYKRVRKVCSYIFDNKKVMTMDQGW